MWSAAAGGPGTVLALAGIILASPETNPHANAYGTGSWLRYVVDFLMLSPGPTLLAMAGLGAFALRRRFRDAEPLLVLLALVTVGVLLAFDPFTKNVRYVALLDLPLRAFAVVALWTACGEGRSRAGRVGFGLAVAALCALDLRTFSWMFVQLGLYDPISVDLLTLRGLVPPPR